MKTEADAAAEDAVDASAARDVVQKRSSLFSCFRLCKCKTKHETAEKTGAAQENETADKTGAAQEPTAQTETSTAMSLEHRRAEQDEEPVVKAAAVSENVDGSAEPPVSSDEPDAEPKEMHEEPNVTRTDAKVEEPNVHTEARSTSWMDTVLAALPALPALPAGLPALPDLPLNTTAFPNPFPSLNCFPDTLHSTGAE